MYIFDDIMEFSYRNNAAYYHSYHDSSMYPQNTIKYLSLYPVPL